MSITLCRVNIFEICERRIFATLFPVNETFYDGIQMLICHSSFQVSWLMTRGNHRIVKHGVSIYSHKKNICYQRERGALKITFTLFSACAYPIVSSNLINVFTRKKKIKPSRRGEIEKNYPRLFIPVNWKLGKNRIKKSSIKAIVSSYLYSIINRAN